MHQEYILRYRSSHREPDESRSMQNSVGWKKEGEKSRRMSGNLTCTWGGGGHFRGQCASSCHSPGPQLRLQAQRHPVELPLMLDCLPLHAKPLSSVISPGPQHHREVRAIFTCTSGRRWLVLREVKWYRWHTHSQDSNPIVLPPYFWTFCLSTPAYPIRLKAQLHTHTISHW